MNEWLWAMPTGGRAQAAEEVALSVKHKNPGTGPSIYNHHLQEILETEEQVQRHQGKVNL